MPETTAAGWVLEMPTLNAAPVQRTAPPGWRKSRSTGEKQVRRHVVCYFRVKPKKQDHTACVEPWSTVTESRPLAARHGTQSCPPLTFGESACPAPGKALVLGQKSHKPGRARFFPHPLRLLASGDPQRLAALY